MNTEGFRWLSPLGVGAGLFLGYGLLNVLVGLVIPSLHRRSAKPEPAVYIVDMWCSLWFAFGVFQVVVVWFGLRLQQPWALAALVFADASQLTGWIVYGRATRDWGAPLFLYPALALIPATILSIIGLPLF